MSTDSGGSHLLVTGCYRSGTTVVEKILNMHPTVTLASQPFPVLYILVKELFNRQIGIERRYPLDHLFLEDAYTPEELGAFLETRALGPEDIEEFIRRMRGYTNGLWTPQILDYLGELVPGTFHQLFAQLNGFIQRLLPSPDARYVGGKEVLVEEYAPLLAWRGCRIVFVVRDPRAMIASLNFGDRDNLAGGPRPVLFSARAWRKSVALALTAHPTGNSVTVRYEDLVLDRSATLHRLTEFLQIEPCSENFLDQGITDQFGARWRGNSSFFDQSGVSARSLDTWRERLPEPVVHFIEAVCAPEMRLMGYPLCSTGRDRERALDLYRDPFECIHRSFPADYSSNPARIAAERQRLAYLETGLPDASEQRKWFLSPAAWQALSGEV